MKIIPGDFAGMPSGSKGSTVASHNRFGYYLRNRVVPTNPNTARQVAVRAAFGMLSTRWSSVLTAAQRAAWDLYGDNVPVINSQGTPINLTGSMMYIRTNTPLAQAGLSIIDNAPTEFNLGDFTAPTNIALAAGTTTISFDVTDSDEWANENDSYMLVYQGRIQGVGRSFFKGPFRFLAALEGDAVTAPTEFSNSSPVYTLSAGNLDWLRVQVIRADGRLSQSLILGPTVIAS